MTEREWLASNDPEAMLKFLNTPQSQSYDLLPEEFRERMRRPWSEWYPTNRQMRLFACACCRLNGRSDAEVDFYERRGMSEGGRQWTDLEWATTWTWNPLLYNRRLPTKETKAALLRDIFGNPWRPYTTEKRFQTEAVPRATVFAVIHARGFRDKEERNRAIESLVMFERWLSDDVLAVAATTYEQRRFEDMPILADALEEAGCTNEDVLNHCRGLDQCSWGCRLFKHSRFTKAFYPIESGGRAGRWEFCGGCSGTGWIPMRGPHVRGCWVLDLIMGK